MSSTSSLLWVGPYSFKHLDDTYEFHRKNMKINRKHYSLMSKIMPAHVTEYIQRRGTRIFYNPMVKFEHCEDGLTYKYGVMHEKDFIHDLSHWREFYVAARLQKPVMTVYNYVGQFYQL